MIHTSGHVSSFTSAHSAMHVPRNIISRNIISHIAVITLSQYVDYTVGKQQPADWVSILPYITSLHSSLCFFFIALIFPNHFPLLQFPGRGSRLCKQVMWSNMMIGSHNNAREEKLKLESSCCRTEPSDRIAKC